MPAPRRVLVIGLDGATLDLLQPLMDEGRMPFLSQLFRDGAGGRLRTIFPPVTAPAWASFMTGKNPGKHGIFEFLHRQRGSLRQTPVNSRLVGATNLWQILSRAGKRLAVINVPLTYPPEPVNGLMIGDFLTPAGANDYTFPATLREELEARFGPYPLYHTQVYTPKNAPHVIDELYHNQSYVTQVAETLMGSEPWDFFMIHFAGTDRLQHELWHIIDPDHPMHDAEESRRHGERVRAFFTLVDSHVARLVQLAGDDASTIIMSDHGFGPVHHFVNFNAWLLQEGFLTLRADALTALKHAIFQLGLTPSLGYRLSMKLGFANLRLSQGMSKRFALLALLNRLFLSLDNVDWAHTVAYARGNYGQLYVNLKGREQFGIVEPGAQFEEVCQSLTQRLKTLHNGRDPQPIVDEVFRTSDIYDGPYADSAPDVQFLLRKTYKALGTLDFSARRVVEPAFGNSGDHRMDGFAVLRGPAIRAGVTLAGARIIDLPATILHLLGLDVPADMDGTVLEQALTSEFMAAHPVAVAQGDESVEQRSSGYTPEEEEEIARRLQQLGYAG